MASPDNTQPDAGLHERIAKVIARSGLCSRRDAEAMIEEGRVVVNGAAISSPALDVTPADKIMVDGALLPLREAPRLWRYYKPKGRVTTHKDPEGRPTVFEALPENLPRLISVGRLDYNTEGLLLLTNDGDLARHMELPSTGWARRYRVRAYGDADQAALDALADGLTVDDVNYGPIEARLERDQGDNVWIALLIREGKNREVRKIMEHLGLTVNRLIRVSFGPFILGDLETGAIEEVKTRVLQDQLGPKLSRELGVKREPTREQRSLGPARAKPAYLRRKPDDNARPPRFVDEDNDRPVRQRRIVPMDGSTGDAVKIEDIKERAPREGFRRDKGGERGGFRPRSEGGRDRGGFRAGREEDNGGRGGDRPSRESGEGRQDRPRRDASGGRGEPRPGFRSGPGDDRRPPRDFDNRRSAGNSDRGADARPARTFDRAGGSPERREYRQRDGEAGPRNFGRDGNRPPRFGGGPKPNGDGAESRGNRGDGPDRGRSFSARPDRAPRPERGNGDGQRPERAEFRGRPEARDGGPDRRPGSHERPAFRPRPNGDSDGRSRGDRPFRSGERPAFGRNTGERAERRDFQPRQSRDGMNGSDSRGPRFPSRDRDAGHGGPERRDERPREFDRETPRKFDGNDRRVSEEQPSVRPERGDVQRKFGPRRDAPNRDNAENGPSRPREDRPEYRGERGPRPDRGDVSQRASARTPQGERRNFQRPEGRPRPSREEAPQTRAGRSEQRSPFNGRRDAKPVDGGLGARPRPGRVSAFKSDKRPGSGKRSPRPDRANFKGGGANGSGERGAIGLRGHGGDRSGPRPQRSFSQRDGGGYKGSRPRSGTDRGEPETP